MVQKNNYSEDDLLKKAEMPSKLALLWHPFYKGKIEIMPKAAIPDFDAFSVWYTPGVAASCLAIYENPETSYEHTSRANTIAIVSNGSRVLGLGNIGPEAGMPVMEGKSLLFKYLGGVDAFPLCINTHDPDKIIEFVELIAPSFAGINLEDIAQPECFYILDALRKQNTIKKLNLCIWHDDQQGTASITLAGVINALKIANKKIKNAHIVFNGAGAANIAIARVMVTAGFPIENMIMCDSKGILSKDRSSQFNPDDWRMFPDKYKMCTQSNSQNRKGDLMDAVKGADVIISASIPRPDTIKPEHIKAMAKKPIVFACANPIPEIYPWVAKDAGAFIVATGRSDFPNQINNSIGFPGIFRGALDIQATTITDEMTIAASFEIAKTAEESDLFNREHIVPQMDDTNVFVREAVVVGLKAIEQGVARKNLTKEELTKIAEKTIRLSRDKIELLMKNNLIPAPPSL